MAAQTRIYEVRSETEYHLVEATSKQAALAHIVRGRFVVSVAEPKSIALAVKAGHDLQVADTGKAAEPAAAE
jgi:hypothetical protein